MCWKKRIKSPFIFTEWLIWETVKLNLNFYGFIPKWVTLIGYFVVKPLTSDVQLPHINSPSCEEHAVVAYWMEVGLFFYFIAMELKNASVGWISIGLHENWNWGGKGEIYMVEYWIDCYYRSPLACFLICFCRYTISLHCWVTTCCLQII